MDDRPPQQNTQENEIGDIQEKEEREKQVRIYQRMVDQVKGYAQYFLIPQKPMPEDQGYRNRDPYYDNLGLDEKGGDAIAALGDPNLYSDAKYRQEIENGRNKKRLPTGRFEKNRSYVESNTIVDRTFMVNRRAPLPPQDIQSFYTGVENKQVLAGREHQSLILASKRRSLDRQDVGASQPIDVYTPKTRTRAPLISLDTESVKVPKRESGIMKMHQYNIGDYYENRLSVESTLTPDSFSNTDRDDLAHRYAKMGNGVRRAARIRANLLSHTS